MAHVYNKQTVELLQKAIDKKQVTVEKQEYGFLDRLYMTGIRIDLVTDSVTGRRDGMHNISNYHINTDYISVWKTFSPGHFLIQDFKKDVRNEDGECPYIILKTTLNLLPVRAILREIFEDSRKVREAYGDVSLDNKLYTIIKMCPDDPDDDTWLSGLSKIDIDHCDAIDRVDGLDVSLDKNPVHEARNNADEETLLIEDVASTYI